MTVLRTPDERFANLPGFPFAPHYLDDLTGFANLRVHYVDEGPRDAKHVFLCLHGEPTWSYLYRRMIPVFVNAGHRVVAPDLFGFGRSDKPEEADFYTFERHRDLLLRFIERLDLRNVALVVQDWGGLLGLTLSMDQPQRFTHLVAMNTALGVGDVPLGEGFLAWRAYNNATPDLPVGKVVARGTPHLSAAEIAAYDAPFPDMRYKTGVHTFPKLVPDHTDAPGAALSRRAREFWRHDWSGKSFMAVGLRDPVLGPPTMKWLRGIIRDCPPPLEIAGAGHFVQEWGETVARAALEQFFARG
jgi:pimeloyl-ACP methyl ester carboxylesterase